MFYGIIFILNIFANKVTIMNKNKKLNEKDIQEKII